MGEGEGGESPNIIASGDLGGSSGDAVPVAGRPAEAPPQAPEEAPPEGALIFFRGKELWLIDDGEAPPPSPHPMARAPLYLAQQRPDPALAAAAGGLSTLVTAPAAGEADGVDANTA